MMTLSTDTATISSQENLTESPTKRRGRADFNPRGVDSIQNLKPGRSFRNKKYGHIADIHSVPKSSYLSYDDGTIPIILGLRNLVAIVLAVQTAPSMLKHLKTGGVFRSGRYHKLPQEDLVFGAALFVITPCHLLLSYVFEIAAAWRARALIRLTDEKQAEPVTHSGKYTLTDKKKGKIDWGWTLIGWLHGINVAICLAITTMVVFFFVYDPLIGAMSEAHAIIVCLKTISYALTNQSLRHAYLHPPSDEKEAVPAIYSQYPYPKNITAGNLVYFWWAPTLVYQPVYPRTPKIRWSFVATRLGEVLVLSAFIWVLSEQYALPVLHSSIEIMASLDFFLILERMIKLSAITLLIWLAGFLALFQSFLNAVAEIMQFADRDFYGDWWNSPDLGFYWRTWNKPVYQYMKRHVYSPLVRRGWSSKSASIIVFMLSGILHELAIGIPIHSIIGIAFLGMVCQLPLIAITTTLEKVPGIGGKSIGNCIFWVSFILIGQPLTALCYFLAWKVRYEHGSVSVVISKCQNSSGKQVT